ncbi:Proteophosphoglycan ppg4 [Favolaschia claudopus]|uniref:Proteophosphoglycan ppg4 n=1 Tax=Favolaschia claudopus TaxID=2862362 RepID=A0AAV9Z1S4_9AGAR
MSREGVRTYYHYFTQPRPRCPRDKCVGTSISDHAEAEEGYTTTLVQFSDVSDLSHPITVDVNLDLAFVAAVLSSTGPDIHAQPSLWDWRTWPVGIRRTADGEPAYYPWLEWAVYGPAAHAAAAVVDELITRTGQVISSSRTGRSCIRCVTANHPRGVTDLIHELEDENEDPEADNTEIPPFTLHEVKRAAVLSVDGVNVLEDLVVWASKRQGFQFRTESGQSQEKARRLLIQAIDELVYYDTTHIVLSTQHHYVLLQLSGTCQLRVSRLYQINDSQSQLEDITELVLFYAHAIVNPGTPYSQRPTGTSTTLVYHVSIPPLPSPLFQPYEALFRNGRLTHRAKLSPAKEFAPTFSFPALPLRFHGDANLDRPDTDVGISFGRLVFWFLAFRVVAKTARSPSATQRLLREFHVYKALRIMQRGTIPTLIGLYTNTSNGSLVLITSHVGAPLVTFSSLTLKQRRTLFSRLLGLHRAGIQHNDFEPRNITISSCSSSPVILDFDNATLYHDCQGESCIELLEAARRLGLDPEEELHRFTSRQCPLRLFLGAIVLFCLLGIVAEWL